MRQTPVETSLPTTLLSAGELKAENREQQSARFLVIVKLADTCCFCSSKVSRWLARKARNQQLFSPNRQLLICSCPICKSQHPTQASLRSFKSADQARRCTAADQQRALLLERDRLLPTKASRHTRDRPVSLPVLRSRPRGACSRDLQIFRELCTVPRGLLEACGLSQRPAGVCRA